MSLRRPQPTVASRMCFAVAIGASVAAAIGCVVNLFLSGWMATAGMLVVCLFYLAMGIFNLNWVAEPRAKANRHALHIRRAGASGLGAGTFVLEPQSTTFNDTKLDEGLDEPLAPAGQRR